MSSPACPRCGDLLPEDRGRCPGCGASTGLPMTEAERVEHRKPGRAHYLVSQALRNGTLTKPSQCENCGAGGPLEGHHEDYDKPLEVDWLCRPCHRAQHVLTRSLARAA